MHKVVPVAGIADLEKTRDELITQSEVRHSYRSSVSQHQYRIQLHTLILLNMGAILDLPSSEWFGDYDPQVTVHIIDSSRPQNLATLFGAGENGDRIIIWDDGGAEKLEEEKKAWEAIMVSLSCFWF